MRFEKNEAVVAFVLKTLGGRLNARGLAADTVQDDLDLLASGVIDSLGLLELITAIEGRFHITFELANLDPERITKLGPLCEHVEQQRRSIA